MLNDLNNKLKSRNFKQIKFLSLNKFVMKSKNWNSDELINDPNLKNGLSGEKTPDVLNEMTSKTYTDVEIDLNGYPKIIQKTISTEKPKAFVEENENRNWNENESLSRAVSSELKEVKPDNDLKSTFKIYPINPIIKNKK